MRITIDTQDTPVQAPTRAEPADPSAQADAIDGGSGADPGSPSAAAKVGAIDAGGPPAWLVAAVGATRALSQTAALSGSGAAGDDSSRGDADAGGGPAMAPGDLVD